MTFSRMAWFWYLFSVTCGMASIFTGNAVFLVSGLASFLVYIYLLIESNRE